MKTMEGLEEEVNKSFQEIQENKWRGREMNKMVQYLKMEVDSMKKTQTEGILEMKREFWTGTT